ncbi:MAG: heavy metal-associated domain-containing protein [Bacteroidetes bacterium]|nr:MAG: heavy metal-associated domain-containing protein [Bacteroidota bacterium]
MNYIKGFGTELVFILTEMAPYLMLGFIFAGLLHLVFPKKRVRKYMGQNNFRSIFNAALLGVPLPLCSCGVIPTGISFYKHGASKASTVSFLISTPQTGVDSIFVTYSMLGLPMAIIRPIVAFVTGLFGGLVTKRIDPEKAVAVGETSENGDELPRGFIPKVKEMFRYSFIDFLQDISNWLIIGLLIAALISVIIPDDFFADKIPNDFLGMLIILVISIPVYICATASVPVAAVLMLKGLSPGAALVLLMAGPATNAATITMIGKVLGKKSLIGYLGAIITGALLSGLLIDYFFPARWFSVSEHFGHMGHNHEAMLPDWLKTGSAVMLTLLIINGYFQKYLNTRKMNSSRIASPGASVPNFKTIQVGGMTCNHCKENVENSIKSVQGVEEVNVDLSSGKVIIKGSTFNLEKIKAGIISIGYKVIK